MSFTKSNLENKHQRLVRSAINDALLEALQQEYADSLYGDRNFLRNAEKRAGKLIIILA